MVQSLSDTNIVHGDNIQRSQTVGNFIEAMDLPSLITQYMVYRTEESNGGYFKHTRQEKA